MWKASLTSLPSAAANVRQAYLTKAITPHQAKLFTASSTGIAAATQSGIPSCLAPTEDGVEALFSEVAGCSTDERTLRVYGSGKWTLEGDFIQVVEVEIPPTADLSIGTTAASVGWTPTYYADLNVKSTLIDGGHFGWPPVLATPWQLGYSDGEILYFTADIPSGATAMSWNGTIYRQKSGIFENGIDTRMAVLLNSGGSVVATLNMSREEGAWVANPVVGREQSAVDLSLSTDLTAYPTATQIRLAVIVHVGTSSSSKGCGVNMGNLFFTVPLL